MVTRGSWEERSAPSLYHEIAGQGNTLFVTCKRKTLHFHYCKKILFLFKCCENSQFENIHFSTISRALTFQQCENFPFQTMQKLSLSINAKTFYFQPMWKLSFSSKVKTFTFKQCENFHFPAMWKLPLSNNVKTFTFQQRETLTLQLSLSLLPATTFLEWAVFSAGAVTARDQ